MNRLPELLKRLRTAKGYSLRQVEQLTNGFVTHGYIHTLERGRDRYTGKPVMPSPRIIKILSEVYDYPYEELLRAAGYLPPASPQPVHLEEMLKNNYVFFENQLLTSRDKEDLLQVFSALLRTIRSRERAARRRSHNRTTAGADYYSPGTRNWPRREKTRRPPPQK